MASEHSYGFGELLQTFRQRCRLTQQQLAAQLGVHRNTISGWERGMSLPESKGLVLELVRLLRLNDQEARQLLEASLTALAPLWSVPYPRNPFFTGREETLEALHALLAVDQAVALTQSYALHGLGGVGKTQLALEYAYRYALEYSAVFWISAESVEQIHHSFLSIAEQLSLPERKEAEQQRIVVAVQRWLSAHSHWLLIWDNLDDLELLPRFLPAARGGALLITTRAQALGTLAQGIELSPMPAEEALLFLLRRAKVLNPASTREQLAQFAQRAPEEYDAAKELAQLLGGLPLALDQAGAYVEETGCSLSDYVQRYRQQRGRLLARRGGPGADHPHSVTATLLLAYQRLEREQPAAAALLRVCAFLHAEAIPEELFEADVLPCEAALEGMAADAYQLDQAIAALRRLSLAQRQNETRTLSIHRLVQAVMQDQMSEPERAAFQQQALRLLHRRFPDVSHDTWGQCERLLRHALTCAAAVPDQAGGQILAEMLRRAGDYLRRRGQYRLAEPLYQRARHIWEQVIRSEHAEYAAVLSGLARLFYEEGKYDLAEPLYQRALRIQEWHLGPTSPDLASLLNNLALLYREQGKYDLAEALYQRSIAIWEQAFGPEHPDLAHSLNGLALISFEQGKYELAEPLYERVLHIREQTSASEHLLASPLINLALLYIELGKYEQAEPLYQRALDIRERALGPEHPHVAYPLDGLALACFEQGQYEQAEALYQRALRIREQAFGPEHPDLAYSLNGLALVYFEQGKYELAEPLCQRALHIWEQMDGPKHAHVAYPLTHLARIYTEQGKYALAEPLYQRAVQVWEEGFGPEHPELSLPLNELARLCMRRGKYEQAEALYERALAIRVQRLGPDHPKTAQTLADLAALHQQQGRLSEAQALYGRALAIQEQRLGSAHPHMAKTRACYAQLLQEEAHLAAMPRSVG